MKPIVVLIAGLLVALASSLAVPSRVLWGADTGVDATPPAHLAPEAQQAPTPAAPALLLDRLSTAEGLSHHVVTSIVQDQRGFIWIGTEGGVNKYDGYEFTPYRHDPDDPMSFARDLVDTILEDRAGNLWIGTAMGLERLDRSTGSFVQVAHDPSNPASVSPGPVMALYEDTLGALWIGAVGLSRYEPEDGTFTRLLEDVAVYAIHEDRTGNLWIGTSDGLKRVNRETDTIQSYTPTRRGQPILEEYDVVAIDDDAQGALWFGIYEDGLVRVEIAELDAVGREGTLPETAFTVYQHNPDDHLSLSDNRITFVHEDGSGRLWVGTWGGLDLFAPDAGTAAAGEGGFYHYRNDPYNPRSLSHDLVMTMLEDRSGVLWLGTAGGVNKASEQADRFTLYRQRLEGPLDSQRLLDALQSGSRVRLVGLSASLVTAVYEDYAGQLWVGTFDGGLDRIDRIPGTVRVYQNDPGDTNTLASDYVTSLVEDGEGTLWVGTNRGLEQYVPNVDAFWSPVELRGRSIAAVLEDRSGTLWVAAGEALARREPGARDFAPFPLPESFSVGGGIATLYEDQAGFLWVGTRGGGIGVWSPNRDGFALYTHSADDPQSLSSDWILSVYEDPGEGGVGPEPDVLWIGTSGGGLNRFDRATQTFTSYTEADGLPGEIVRCILGDAEGNLWLGTNRGLTKFVPATGTFHHYDERDGLQGGEFYACHQSDSGEMFFGGLQGLNAFFPEQVEDNPHVPPMVITKLLVSNRVARTDLPLDAEIELSYRESFLSFEFAALDYVAPEENQYAYKMEGLDAEWVRAGTRRHADYPALRPGSYIFRVRGSNNDGVWNEEGAAVRVTITPPIWETWWFQTLGGLLLVGALAAGVWLRVRSLEAQRRELARQVSQRTAELRQEMDQRIEVEQALRQSEADRAVVEERNRLARDLHDSVTQSLYSLTLLAEAGQRHAAKGELEPVQGYQSRIAEIGHQALNEMRLLIYELRPPVLETEGLVGALRQRLEAVEQRAGIGTRLVLEGEAGTVQIPATMEEELFRIAQEALNNALRHAAASAVEVRVAVEPGEAGLHVELEVRDDGSGFDPDRARGTGGMGLDNMRERAGKIGAILTVHSAPGKGTQVQAALGLRRDAPDPVQAPIQ